MLCHFPFSAYKGRRRRLIELFSYGMLKGAKGWCLLPMRLIAYHTALFFLYYELLAYAPSKGAKGSLLLFLHRKKTV